MNATEKATIDKNSKALSLQSMRFNRFLGIRYATALFFFVNLYWLILMHTTWIELIPGLLMVVALPSIYEQLKLFGQHSNRLPFTIFYFRFQTAVNVALSISVVTPVFKTLFTFVNDTNNNRGAVMLLLLIGLGLSVLMLRKLTLIQHNKDKFYYRLSAYQASLEKGKEMNQ